MILVDWQIRLLCENQKLVEPYDPELINPSSLDIRLGNNLIVHVKGDGWFTRLWKKITRQEIIEPHEEFLDISDRTKEDPYILKPNEFVLAETLEYFNIPANFGVDMKLKSSRAREGLSHALAGWIDNGFHGVLTLELKNYSDCKSISIYPRLRIGQMIFYRSETPEKTYQNGRYAGHKTVLGSLDVVK